MHDLSTFAKTKNTIAGISAASVFRHDILPWLVATGVMVLLHDAIILLVLGGSTSETDRILAGSAVSGVYLNILGLAGVWMAVRSKGLWLWIPYVVTIFLISGNIAFSVGYTLTENTLFTFMLTAVMVLSIGRIVEYIRLRLGEEPTRRFKLSIAAWVMYVALILVSFALTNPSFGEWVTCATMDCRPL